MIKFCVGDTVEWSSQAGGRPKTKKGVVARVIAQGERPTRDEVEGAGMARHEESYLVIVGTRYYWPRNSALRPAQPDDPQAPPPATNYVGAMQLVKTIADVESPYYNYFGEYTAHCHFCGADECEHHEFTAVGCADGTDHHFTPQDCIWVRARRLLGRDVDVAPVPQPGEQLTEEAIARLAVGLPSHKE